MPPTDDPMNLIWNSLAAANALFDHLLSTYGLLIILIPIVYQFFRLRNLSKAKQNLANRR